MYSATKKIITDCDGVLLRWTTGFDLWMMEQGYLPVDYSYSVYQAQRYDIDEEETCRLVREFNTSPGIANLKPLRDSVKYVKQLANEGWKFDVVSSLSPDPNAQLRRKINLFEVFGEEVFDKIYCHLDFNKSKYDFLNETYGGTGYWWIEDLPHNAEAGDKAGLKSLVLDHPYNKEYSGLRVKSWEEIYSLVTT
jgi:FMN phosphatase YigB (HAD superfamily)